nr:CAHS 7b [Mesobiotus philippinicus]
MKSSINQKFSFTTKLPQNFLIGEGMSVNVQRVTAASQEIVYESPELAAEAQRDYEDKEKEHAQLAVAFEKELERRTEIYRKQQEEEAEKIRRELEKQHLRDVEFRQSLVEVTIENQKKQIDIETRYAKRDMDRQKRAAKESLERNKFKQEVQVSIQSGAGATISEGLTKLKQEKEVTVN